MNCPNISSASILLYFLFRQASSVTAVPLNCPQKRDVIDTTERARPTLDDFAEVSRYQMSTVADQDQQFPSSIEVSGISIPRSMMHNDDFLRAVLDLSESMEVFRTGHPYSPGILSGLWEGHYLVCEPSIILSR